MYARVFTRAAETRRFLISNAGVSGWEVTEEQDSRVVWQVRYTDWHRVERAKQNFARVADMLTHTGWVESSGYSTNR